METLPLIPTSVITKSLLLGVSDCSVKAKRIWLGFLMSASLLCTTDAIVQAARGYVKEQLQAAMDDCKSTLPPDISQADLVIAMQQDEAVQEWHQARLRLEGEYGDKTWQYIFVQTKNPNAFVTEILPQRFFITSSMLQIAETSDELAVVLGHEGEKVERLATVVGCAVINSMSCVCRTVYNSFASLAWTCFEYKLGGNDTANSRSLVAVD